MPVEVSEGESTRTLPSPTPAAAEETVALPAPSAADVPADTDAAPHCANCLTPLAGPYCSQCGQHVADYHRSVWRFVADFFDNTICWDNKLLRTLGPLFKQPGWLTQEFMAGRRVRYVHPLRLFLFTSAVCLTLLQFNHGFEKARVHVGKNVKPGVSAQISTDDDKDDEDDDDKKPAVSPSPPSSPVPSSSVAGISPPAPAASPAAAPSPTVPPAVSSPAASASPAHGHASDKERADNTEQLLRDTLASVLQGKDPEKDEALAKRLKAFQSDAKKSNDEVQNLNKKVATNIQQKASWVALMMLPIFAWLMRFTYGRRGGFFFAYLVFSLHYHTFLLLFWTAFSSLATLAQATHLSMLAVPILLGFLVPPWYLYLSLRRFYGESPTRTAVKTFAIGGLHLLAIIIGVAIAGVGGSLTIK